MTMALLLEEALAVLVFSAGADSCGFAFVCDSTGSSSSMSTSVPAEAAVGADVDHSHSVGLKILHAGALEDLIRANLSSSAPRPGPRSLQPNHVCIHAVRYHLI